MLAEFYAVLNRLLGLELQAHDLAFHHMAWRAFIVFCLAILLSRMGDRRLLGHNAGFDIMLLVVLGSLLSRAINGAAAFFPTLGASLLLVGLHHVVATIALRSHGFSKLVKGRPIVLVRDGVPDRKAMAGAKITADDLEEHLRLNANVRAPDAVAEARLERNGTISVVKATPPAGS